MGCGSSNSQSFFPNQAKKAEMQEVKQRIETIQLEIQSDLTKDYNIAGLGHKLQTNGYYQWFIRRWYDDEIKEGRLTRNPYDQLALCYACLDLDQNSETIDKGIAWYRKLKRQNQNYQILFGYACLLSMKSQFEQAIRIFRKIVHNKPSFEPAYQGIAMIYQYKRIIKQKSCEMAKKLLQLNPKNMWALFILAKNQKTSDQKIQKLTEVTKTFPKFARAFNEIGIVYGAQKKMYDEAIQWYKKTVEITPEYASCYKNIGVIFQLKKQYKIALQWYIKAIERDNQYKTAYVNATNVFDQLKYSDDQIIQSSFQKPGIDSFYYRYYIGLAYNDKRSFNVAIKWYQRALDFVNNFHYKVYNSMGITFDDLKKWDEAQRAYLKAIELNQMHYQSYYNIAILFKNKGDLQSTIKWYKKALQINPQYSYAYNNLGNIYKTRGEINQAIKCYQSAVEHLSTYTLQFRNLYAQTFNAFNMANQCLKTDNNNLSKANKEFLAGPIQQFKDMGNIWRKQGYIDAQQMNQLNKLIASFQNNFKSVYNGEKTEALKQQRILKQEVLNIIAIVFEDKFKLNNLSKIYDNIKDLFFYNQQYFHILPQLFIQYFWIETFKEKRPVLQVQSQLYQMIKNLGQQINKQSQKNIEPIEQAQVKLQVNATNQKVNLFKTAAFFKDYAQLYSQIIKVNEAAKQSLDDFYRLVEKVRIDSNGIPYGANMKIPTNPQQQFKVILRILQKMFKNQIDKDRVKIIIQKIDKKLSNQVENNKLTFLDVVRHIISVWTQEISLILRDRRQKKIETKFQINDLVRGKIMFKDLDSLAEAVQITQAICNDRNYTIVQFDNRLSKPETKDAVFKIQIKDAVCELQLALKQDSRKYHLIHSIYQLQRSPLGCIFASYLFLSKRVNYPFLANCVDIQDILTKKNEQKDNLIFQACKYIINQLKEGQNLKK